MPDKMNDNSIMTFGKHKGEKLINVPSTYWFWLEEQDWFEVKYSEEFEYFQDNLDAIQ